MIELPNSKLRTIGHRCDQLLKDLEDYRPKLYHHKVIQKLPPMGYQKCNTDGATKGNPGPNFYGFCIRDHRGNLCYAQAGLLGQLTNIQAEAKAILEAIKYWQRENNIAKLLELDFLVMVKVLKNQTQSPWEIIEEVEEIK